MGKIDEKKHDGFVGDIGPLTVTRWKGRVVVKTRQKGNDKPRSEKQKAASKRFGMLTRFVSVCNEYVMVGFRNSEKGNAQHAAIAANMGCGVTGTWPDLVLNYEGMKMSEGSLKGLCGARAWCEAGAVHIHWTEGMRESRQEGRNNRDNMVNALIYNTCTEEAIVEIGVAQRKDSEAVILLPEAWCRQRMTVAAYVCVSDEREVSESCFLGMMETEAGGAEYYSGMIYKTKKSKAKRRKAERDEIDDEGRKHVEGVSGKVGPLIAYNYIGIPCIKGRYKVTKEPTEKKRKANERFGMMTGFLKSLYEMVKVGFRGESSRMTQMNAAIKHNYGKAFEDDGTRLAYERMELSVGRLAGAAIEATWEDDGIAVRWTPEGGDRDDKVMIGIYDETRKEGICETGRARREEGESRVTVPPGWRKGDEAHVYVAFEAGGETSGSGYARAETGGQGRGPTEKDKGERGPTGEGADRDRSADGGGGRGLERAGGGERGRAGASNR